MYIYGNTPLTYMTFYDFDSNLKKILQPTALHTFCRCCFLCLIAHFLLNFFQIATYRILPGRKALKSVVRKFFFADPAVHRAFCLTRISSCILGSADRRHLDVHARLLKDLNCKVIPAAKSLIRRMVTTIFVTLNHINQQTRQIVCVSRGTDLIIHNTDCPALFANAQHRLDEVLAVHAKYPRDTDDEKLLYQLLDCQLALILRLTVGVEWFPVVIRLPRRVP